MPATVSTINAGPALTYTTFDLLNPDEQFDINSVDWTSGSRYFVDAVFLTLTGGKLDTDPYLTMSDWYQTNRKAIKGNKVEDALQYGPFGLAVEVFTRANIELTAMVPFGPTGALGWGYIHPAANIWSQDFTHCLNANPPTCADTDFFPWQVLDTSNKLYTCLPVNFDKWSSYKSGKRKDGTTPGAECFSYMAGNAATNCSWYGFYGFDCSADGTGSMPTWCSTPSTTGGVDCTGTAAGGSCFADPAKFQVSFIDTVSQNGGTVATGCAAGSACSNTQWSKLEHNVAVGEIGDAIAVLVSNKQNPVYKPYAIRAAAPAATAMVIDAFGTNEISTAGTATVTFDSWPSDGFPTVTDFSSLAKSKLTSSTSVTWAATAPTCGTAWTGGTGCQGLSDMWAFLGSTAPTALAGGQFAMHHWLADERPRDPTQLLQFNLGDTLQMLVYEQKAPWPVDINTAFGDDTYPVPSPPSGWNVYCDTTTTQYNWAIHEWVVAGAQNAIGATAAIAGLVAALF